MMIYPRKAWRLNARVNWFEWFATLSFALAMSAALDAEADFGAWLLMLLGLWRTFLLTVAIFVFVECAMRGNWPLVRVLVWPNGSMTYRGRVYP
jgi:hypothetical protein